jgi:hypothetical protein
VFFQDLREQILKILATLNKKLKMGEFAGWQILRELPGPLRPYFLSGDPFCPVVWSIALNFTLNQENEKNTPHHSGPGGNRDHCRCTPF